MSTGSRVSRMRTGVTGTNVDSLAPIADAARDALKDQIIAMAVTMPTANHTTERIRSVTMPRPPETDGHSAMRMCQCVANLS
jgi:hypothetical protein